MGKFDLPEIQDCMYYNNGTFISLDEMTYQKIQDLCINIKRARNSRFIFRADSHVNETYDSDYSSSTLANRIFMVGVKGNIFFNTYDSTNVDLYNHGIDLFRRIQNSLYVNNGTLNFQRRMQSFIRRSPTFVAFFGDNANMDKFANAFRARSKWLVNDYYEAFLHSIYRNGYNNALSQFVSTSSDIRIARNFQNGGILMIGWLRLSGIISYHDLNKRDLRIEKLGLPVYDKSVFYNQQEFCLKYGILPHVIIGYFYNDNFIINHHLIEDLRNRQISDIIHGGCIIDQKDFRQILHETRYQRGYNLTTHQFIS